MLAVVLTEDYGVHYDPQRRAGPASSRMDDGFFRDPRSVFLHGLLGPVKRPVDDQIRQQGVRSVA